MIRAFAILDRFLLGQRLTEEEFTVLKELFTQKEGSRTVEAWLAEKWDAASSEDVEISYDTLRQRVEAYERSRPLWRRIVGSGMVRGYQRVAAVLLIPLFLLLSLFVLNPFSGTRTYVAETPWGEKARLILPDGSRVMLNAGSRISYTSDFDRRDRRLSLEGEAYFEVEKNKGKPFVVVTPCLDVRVTGTKFNVKAYTEETTVIASLLEGSVDVTTRADGKCYRLTPGRSLALDKISGEVTYPDLNNEVIFAWKDNRLVFEADDIASLAEKIERWYDVKVAYDPTQFRNSKFTVRLRAGERLENLIDIVETVLDAHCSMHGDTLVIAREKERKTNR